RRQDRHAVTRDLRAAVGAVRAARQLAPPRRTARMAGAAAPRRPAGPELPDLRDRPALRSGNARVGRRTIAARDRPRPAQQCLTIPTRVDHRPAVAAATSPVKIPTSLAWHPSAAAG